MSNPLSHITSRLLGGTGRTATVRRNVVGSLFIKGISILIQLMLVPLTLGYLSKELYGVWLTISSVVLWLGFFDVGFSLGLKNKLAEAIARNDFERGRQLVSTTYGILLAIFIPLGAIAQLIIPHIPWSRFLNVDPALNPVLIDAMRILIVSFVLQMVFNTISTIVAAFQKVALSGAFPVIGNAISLVAIWLLARYTSPSLLNMAWAISFIPVIVFIISSLLLFRGPLRPVAPSPRFFRRDAIRDIFSLGVKFFIIQIQMVVMQQATNFLISNISNPDYVTYYNIAFRYLGTVIMVFNLVLGPLWPAFTDAYTKRDFNWMKQTYKVMVKLYIWAVFILIALCCIAPFVYRLWVGSQVNIPSAMTLILTVYVCISLWDNIQVYLINGIGTVKLQSYVTLIGIFFHIPLSYILGHYVGAYGVIISLLTITLIYATFFSIQIRKILSQKAIGIWCK